MSAPPQPDRQYRGWVTAMAQALQQDDAQAFRAALAGFDSVRNLEVTTGIRKVTGDLKTALDRFRIDSRLVDLAQQVPDARHRLAHVLRLTDDAAHRTMDLVDRCCPLAEQIAHEAERLAALQERSEWSRDFKPQLRSFLKQAATGMSAVRSNLAEVLLTQGYQDLSGQIIRGIMSLVDELEAALGELVRIGGAPPDNTGGAQDGQHGYGPVVPGINHGSVVGGQQDVDALLSDFGV
jgi:chemotaxis protein CheZ